MYLMEHPQIEIKPITAVMMMMIPFRHQNRYQKEILGFIIIYLLTY